MIEMKEKAKEVTSNTNVNVAMTQQDSIFQNISLPGGISSKATEYKQLAAKGDRWESPVFSIGSAKASSDIPKLTQVTRKSHNVAGATVRGGNHPNSGSNFSPNGTASSTGQGLSSGAGTGAGFAGAGLASNGHSENATTGTATTYPAGAGYPSGTATSGFSNQLDQAFDSRKGVSGVQPTNGSANVTNGSATKTYYDGVTQ